MNISCLFLTSSLVEVHVLTDLEKDGIGSESFWWNSDRLSNGSASLFIALVNFIV